MLITYFGRTDDYFFDAFYDLQVTNLTSTLIEGYEATSGFESSITGTGLGSTGPATFTGTIDSVTTTTGGGDPVATVTGISWSAQAFRDATVDYNDFGDESGLIALYSLQNVTFDATGSVDPVEFSFAGATSRLTFRGSDFADAVEGGGAADRLEGRGGNDLIGGNGGNDKLFGQSGSDTLLGGNGKDTIDGGGGNDHLFDGGGDDVVKGGAGRDMFHNEGGTDVFRGGTGIDTLITDVRGLALDDMRFDAVAGEHGRLNSTVGQDLIDSIENFTLLGNWNARVTGTGAANLFRTGGGKDTVDAGGGKDTIEAGGGNDLLLGRGGADDLEGGGGNDTLKGHDGTDVLAGGRGNDRLFGGGQADSFVFAGHIDADRIKDYQKGTDALLLDDALWGGGLTRKQVVGTYATDTGADILFDFGGGETILLEGVGSRFNLYLDIEII